MSYEETLRYIHSEKWQKHKNSLERIRTLLGKLGDPQKELRFIHVAGTNGKGSVCAMLDSVLRRAGYHTGLFTSPFLGRFNERMRVDGDEISDGTLEEICDLVRPAAESMDEKPSEFELITAIGMVWFRKCKCDVVVLEVGLGGEFDSTNVIDPPDCAVICSIGLDHTSMLGETIPEIASAKAGILKPGSTAVTGSGDEEADVVFRRVCAEKGIALHEVDLNRLIIKKSDSEGSVFDFGEYHDLSLHLRGTFQPRNAAIAVETLKVLRDRGYHISDDDVREGLRTARWPGRFELLRSDPAFILDGAHNPHGVQATLDSLLSMYPGRRFIFLIAVMKDKNVRQMVEMLVPYADVFIAVRPEYSRAMDPADIVKMVCGLGARGVSAETIEQGVRLAVSEAGERGVICALGSLYISESVRKAVCGLAV